MLPNLWHKFVSPCVRRGHQSVQHGFWPCKKVTSANLWNFGRGAEVSSANLHMEPVAAALARLSEAQAKCAKELKALSDTHADSPAWASAGIAAVVRLCHDPAAAADAAAALDILSVADDAIADLIRGAGAFPPLVALLTGGLASYVVTKAAGALANLTCNDANQVPVIEAGAIAPLVALLSGGPESEAAERAAVALHNLVRDEEAGTIIVEAGAIAPLVALLSGGPESAAAETAAGALRNLACDEEAGTAIVEAGAIPPLVALLSGGTESAAAERAAGALTILTLGANSAAVLLEEVARTETDCSSWEGLRARLRECASARLQAAEEGTAVAALEHAITLAVAVQRRRGRPSARARAAAGAQGRRGAAGAARVVRAGLACAARRVHLPDHDGQDARCAAAAHCRPQRSRTAAARVPRLRHRPGGGVRRPLIRAVGHPLGAPRRQRLEPAHPRAAPAERAHPEPQPEAAHAGARRGHAARGGHRRGERQRRRPAAGFRCGSRRAVERAARSKAEPSRSLSIERAVFSNVSFETNIIDRSK